MSEEKKRKLIGAGTAIAVVMLFFLIVTMVYQLIMIGVKQKQEATLKKEIEQRQRQIEETEDEIEKWNQEWRIYVRSVELGYVKGDD